MPRIMSAMNPDRAFWTAARAMLQVAIANPGSGTIPALRYRRGLIVLGAVIGAHLVLLILALTARDRTVERTVEPVVITALLLSPAPEPSTPAVPAAPADVVAPTMRKTPPVARPVARTKPAPQPHPQPQPRSAAPPAPSAPSAPLTPPAPNESATPSSSAPPSPAPTTPSPATPTTTSTATDHASSLSNAPKNVSHIDCSIPKPDYPDVSKRRRENGTAIVHFVVGLTGGIDTMQLQKSSGYPRLDDAALAAVRAGVCQPYSENGSVMRAAYSQSFVFGLAD
jgi:protein TonB